jgi:tetratricopeptide (TPR) repeat protein
VQQATILLIQGDLAASIQACSHAWSIWEELQQQLEQNLEIMLLANAISDVLRRQGRLQQAENWQDCFEPLLQADPPPDHTGSLQADAAAAARKLEAALEAYSNARQDWEGAASSEQQQRHTADLLEAEARALLELGALDSASGACDQALASSSSFRGHSRWSHRQLWTAQ